MVWKAFDKKFIFKNLIVFTLSKSCVFIAPIILSNVLDLPTYGWLEYGLGVAGIVAMIVSGGFPASYPYFQLKERRKYNFAAFLIHFLVLSFFSVAYFLLSRFHLLSQGMIWSLCLSLIISNIYIISTVYKTHERPTIAVVTDSVLYIYLLLLCLVFYFFPHLRPSLILFLDLLLALIFVHVYVSFRSHFRLSYALIGQYKNILKYGIPLIVNSLMVVLLTTAGRLLVKGFLSEEAVGIYSFYFRISGSIVILQQFVNILFYKKLFVADKGKIDRYLSAFFLLLVVINTICYFALPVLLKPYLKLFSDYEHYRNLHWLLTVQIVMWMAVSFNEGFIVRENLSLYFTRQLFILLASFITAIAVLKYFVNFDLLTVTFFHLTVLFIGYLLQVHLLHTRQWQLRKFRLLNIIFYASGLAVFCITLINK